MIDYTETKEIKLTLVEKHLAAYEQAIALMPKIKVCLESFDGKQMNKRIDTALKKIDDRLSFRFEYNSCDVQMRIDDRSVSGKPDSHGCCNAYYLSDRFVYLLSGCLEYGRDKAKSCLVDGKFNANGLLFNYEDNLADTQNVIESVRKYVADMDAHMKEKECIEAEIRKYNDATPWMVNSYFKNRIE